MLSSLLCIQSLRYSESVWKMNSKMNVDKDGFQYVTYKRKYSKKLQSALNNISTFISPFSTPDLKSVAELEKRMSKISEAMERSDFLQKFQEIMEDVFVKLKNSESENRSLEDGMSSIHITESKETVDVVCYGLGSVYSWEIARHQLAFLLALRNYFNIKNVSIYDPVFSVKEIDYLTNLGLTVLEENENAKRAVVCKTIFFMPHCDIILYNNLLWSNWNPNHLSNVIIIGNSFSCYDRIRDVEMETLFYCLKSAISFVTEISMPLYSRDRMFNDTSVHYFDRSALPKLSADIWTALEEPVYFENKKHNLTLAGH